MFRKGECRQQVRGGRCKASVARVQVQRKQAGLCAGAPFAAPVLAAAPPRIMEAAEEGWHAIGVFNAKYPNSRFQQDIEEMRHHLYRRLAHAVYKIGEFYDKSAKKPKAAIQEYEKLIKRFPNSEWTEEAKQSIHRLQMELEGTSEK